MINRFSFAPQPAVSLPELRARLLKLDTPVYLAEVGVALTFLAPSRKTRNRKLTLVFARQNIEWSQVCFGTRTWCGRDFGLHATTFGRCHVFRNIWCGLSLVHWSHGWCLFPFLRAYYLVTLTQTFPCFFAGQGHCLC